MSEASFSLTIEGMHCGNCVKRVKAALEAVEGVTVDEADIGRAKGSFDPDDTTAQVLAEAVTRAGYPATVDGAS